MKTAQIFRAERAGFKIGNWKDTTPFPYDALYLRFDEATIVESEEVEPGVVLDFDQNNQVVGLEIRGLSSRVPLESLKRMHFEVA